MKNSALLLFCGVVLLMFLPGSAAGADVLRLSYLGLSNLPRGMRNNNPGNIRISASPWKGKISPADNTDGAFEQFTAYVWGLRAMIKNLLTYQSRYGDDTLKKIIYRWAPPADGNDTAAYVRAVALSSGFAPDAPLNLNDPYTMRRVVVGMAAVENGRPDAVTPEQFNAAWNL